MSRLYEKYVQYPLDPKGPKKYGKPLKRSVPDLILSVASIGIVGTVFGLIGFVIISAAIKSKDSGLRELLTGIVVLLAAVAAGTIIVDKMMKNSRKSMKAVMEKMNIGSEKELDMFFESCERLDFNTFMSDKYIIYIGSNSYKMYELCKIKKVEHFPVINQNAIGFGHIMFHMKDGTTEFFREYSTNQTDEMFRKIQTAVAAAAERNIQEK